MITLENVSKKPRVFQRMFGVNVDQFKILVKKISPLWEVAEEKRKNQPGRKREVGGGRKYKFNLDQLVAI